jgi:hypothetical protein
VFLCSPCILLWILYSETSCSLVQISQLSRWFSSIHLQVTTWITCHEIFTPVKFSNITRRQWVILSLNGWGVAYIPGGTHTRYWLLLCVGPWLQRIPSVSKSDRKSVTRCGATGYWHILIYIQQDATLHILLYLEIALHISGGTTNHHQQRKQLYPQHLVFVTPLLLPISIVEELEMVWVCCGWPTIAAGSSNGVTNTRCCRYSCLRSWWWVVVPPETCRVVSG